MRKFENSAQYSGRRVDGVVEGVEVDVYRREVDVYGVAEGVGRRCRRGVNEKDSGVRRLRAAQTECRGAVQRRSCSIDTGR